MNYRIIWKIDRSWPTALADYKAWAIDEDARGVIFGRDFPTWSERWAFELELRQRGLARDIVTP